MDRPEPDLRGALVAVAGALVALGGGVLAGDLYRDGRGLSVLIMVVLLAAGYGVLAILPSLAPAAVVLVATDIGDEGGSVLAMAAGLVVGLVGHLGGRRLTTWLGAAVFGAGVVALVAAIIDDDSKTRATALAIASSGVLVAAILLVVDQRRGVGGRSTPVEQPFAPGSAPERATGSWHPDPSGRYERRWWDGESWTDHVVDGEGRTGIDPRRW